MKANTAEELGEAIKNEEDTIEVEADLGKKVLRIKATGKVAWAIAIGAIAIAVAAILAAPATAGISTPTAALLAPIAVNALGGISIANVAIAIALAGGGVGALNKLRKYKAEKKPDGSVILKRK